MTPNSPIVKELVEQILARDAEGFETFGGAIDDNKRDPLEWLDEAIEEQIDNLIYMKMLKKELQERLN